jgi:hypothetical protein
MTGQSPIATTSLGVYVIALAVLVHTFSLLAVSAVLAILVFSAWGWVH